MPVRTLVQAGKILLPDFMIPAEKPGNDPLGRVGLGNIGVHRNHRLQIPRLSQCNPFGDPVKGNLPGTCWSWPSAFWGRLPQHSWRNPAENRRLDLSAWREEAAATP